MCRFQFTPLREGRRSFPIMDFVKPIISIHAPPRGATRIHLRYFGKDFYFNSRPSARGDRTRYQYVKRHTHFNSRPSARGDSSGGGQGNPPGLFQFTPLREGRHGDGRARGEADRISIHAPPRGATSMNSHMRGEFPFQFTPLREGRRVARTAVVIELIFQFTPLREGRLSRPADRPTSQPFQFTPLREGRPPAARSALPHLSISIHAPPRGATAHSAAVRCFSAAFQFTPLREGRLQRQKH